MTGQQSWGPMSPTISHGDDGCYPCHLCQTISSGSERVRGPFLASSQRSNPNPKMQVHREILRPIPPGTLPPFNYHSLPDSRAIQKRFHTAATSAEPRALEGLTDLLEADMLSREVHWDKGQNRSDFWVHGRPTLLAIAVFHRHMRPPARRHWLKCQRQLTAGICGMYRGSPFHSPVLKDTWRQNPHARLLRILVGQTLYQGRLLLGAALEIRRLFGMPLMGVYTLLRSFNEVMSRTLQADIVSTSLQTNSSAPFLLANKPSAFGCA
ncbi:hypothetical protein DFP72DRAFT_231377 [Ephemerocybe angulata]|uniref:Uncharacterized protein n=1 Tax=Ephemerocybe angulata TaxID=980116 RepID=A0A8H6M9S2_9AGAR|nr:hypothetical protein DFP72DRAFT_231377 [Tulosesus angulatus]